MKALTHAYTGEGKGKTTAGVGLALRAAGAGLKVLYTQFLKDGSSSEIKLLEKTENIDILLATEFFGFIKYMSEQKLEQAKEYYNNYMKKISDRVKEGEYKMLVIDEFMAAYNFEMIDKKFALDFIKNKPDDLELVLTGRDVPEEIAQLCDYLSDIKAVKHPYDKGIKARLGIEY